MPAKPLTDEQKADASRLKQLFSDWQKQRKKAGEASSQEAAAELLGFGQSALSQYLMGKIPLNPEVLSKLAKLLGRDMADISPGLASKMLAMVAPLNQIYDEHISISPDVPNRGPTVDLIGRLLPEGSGNLVTWETPDDLEPDDDRVWIDRYDYRYSAGNGVIQWEVRQKKALPFDIGFFKALGVRPQDCRLAQVHGRSMEPYLFNKDMMMICMAKTRVKDGLIYAVTFEDEPLVKQIFKEPEGALRLHSYNPEFPDKVITADQLEGLQIAGEVIYRSGSGLAGGN